MTDFAWKLNLKQRRKVETIMRFMVIVKANKDSEAGVMPSEKILTEMGEFNEELVKDYLGMKERSKDRR